ncbi:hypothetical protein LTV02_06200 [Nocardia yamanashiensis]|uniref:hypothetical protein n=1 Tax=Nocardia yamanashiensis TaxID=209247 RepID=UPI001E3E5E35|nr:hypothetical protein [Nocardia yamanashiensis]UGT42984.1 hypothetical protein LTV02_06200 [Nocardia yamanashiensis]
MGDDAVIELVRAAAGEVRALAERTEGSVRKRLHVVVHALELAERDIAVAPEDPGEAAALARAIRAGAPDDALVAEAMRVRRRLRRELSGDHPGPTGPRGHTVS